MAPKTELLTYAHVAHEKISPYVTSAKSAAVNSALTAKDYVLGIAVFFNALLDKYPPLKAFVYTLFGAAALPLAVFGGYGLITGGVILTIAATVIGIVQGGFLAFGAFVLFWFLLGALAIASIAAFWFTVSYFSFQVRSIHVLCCCLTRERVFLGPSCIVNSPHPMQNRSPRNWSNRVFSQTFNVGMSLNNKKHSSEDYIIVHVKTRRAFQGWTIYATV